MAQRTVYQRPSEASEIPAAATSRGPKTAAGGPAGIEIVGFPQILYTRTMGDPDTLFIPLLDACREASQLIERLCTRQEDRENATMLSRTHLASVLLRDSAFSLLAKLQSEENFYRVDLGAGTLHLQTRLYAVVSKRAALFRVEVAGKISEGPYAVRNTSKGSVMIQAEESQLRKPNSFSSWLAPECLRVQIEQEQQHRTGQPGPSAPSNGEIQLMIPVSNLEIPVTLRRKADGTAWDIIDGRKGEWVGSLSNEAEASLSEVIRALQDLFGG